MCFFVNGWLKLLGCDPYYCGGPFCVLVAPCQVKLGRYQIRVGRIEKYNATLTGNADWQLLYL